MSDTKRKKIIYWSNLDNCFVVNGKLSRDGLTKSEWKIYEKQKAKGGAK